MRNSPTAAHTGEHNGRSEDDHSGRSGKARDMTHAFAPVQRLLSRYREPAVVQALRSTAAAVVSYVVALRLSSEPAPLTAP